MNILFFIILVLVFISFFYESKELFNVNYFIDKNGRHTIEFLPIILNDIYELNYTDNKQNLIFSGNNSNSKLSNSINITNNKISKSHNIYIKQNIPFSGILKYN